MLKITILDEQEPSVQSADRTKAVQVWSWRNVYLAKPGKWLSQHLFLKKTPIGFHARKNPSEAAISESITFNDTSFSKKRIYIYKHAV